MVPRRMSELSTALLLASGLTMGISGCGGRDASTGPQEEVKVAPVLNEKGEVAYSLENEAKTPAKPGKK